MNQILIIAHTPLASALKSAVIHALPDADRVITALDVQADQSPEQILNLAQQYMARAQQEGFGGTLVMSDVLGATPCNAAQQLMRATPCVDAASLVNVKCVTGVSLPMLFRAVTYSHQDLAQMAQKAIDGAAQGAIELS